MDAKYVFGDSNEVTLSYDKITNKCYSIGRKISRKKSVVIPKDLSAEFHVFFLETY